MHPNWEQSSDSVTEHDFMAQKKKEVERVTQKLPYKTKIEILYPDWDDMLTILDKLYQEG